MTKLRHNVVYVVNLGNYRTDMTISSTALDQSKTLELLSINNNENYRLQELDKAL